MAISGQAPVSCGIDLHQGEVGPPLLGCQRMSKRVVPLDVREDVQQGREPFSRIMGAVAGLQANEALLLIVPFEPFPLYSVLACHGFSHESRRTGTGTWEVLFTRAAIDRVTGQSPALPGS